ncbi:MAG TPA: hypothetical protein VJ761_07515 [Ktedonobacteraceae bacterium]|nr:hypothetical protein [Ktedonobacteraceae bacterium]
MAKPSDSDKRILQTVIDLTDQHGGRPPTLAEVALALGYHSSSRSNIQRQLSKLRPNFVNWTSSSRSLQVTQAGYALLGLEPSQGDVDFPVSDMILPLLASGLTHLASIIESGRPLQSPYPHSWQRGLNMLAAECLLRDVAAPTHTEEAIRWCHIPLKDWPVRFRAASRVLEEALLNDDQPTELCRELAIVKGDAEQEACQKKMLEVMSEAQRNRLPDAYVALRYTLITRPVISDEELAQLSFDPRLGPLGGLLTDLYERVPSVLADGRKVLICGFCGWTLQRVRGQLRCGDERCRLLTGDFIRVATRERPELASQLYRVRHPIRRYVVAPGVYEVNTACLLESLGLRVELWPGYDKYDLRIIFPHQQIWAVDIKDWRFPHLLAPQLTPLPHGGTWTWDHAFYVIPDERVQEQSNYLAILQQALAGVAQTFTILTISQLLAEAHKQFASADYTQTASQKERLHA